MADRPDVPGTQPPTADRDDTPASKAPASALFSQRATQLYLGRLVAYGPAPYEFREGASPSYFAKVQTNRGLKVLWGNDLKRAIHAGQTRPAVGDLIGARRIGRQLVTVREGHREEPRYRTGWIVEKTKFFSDRARQARLARDQQVDTREAIRKQPVLRSTFLSLRAAEDVANRRIKDPRDRELFLSIVREAIGGSIRGGEPLPDVRLRQKPRATSEQPVPTPKRDREGPTR